MRRNGVINYFGKVRIHSSEFSQVGQDKKETSENS